MNMATLSEKLLNKLINHAALLESNGRPIEQAVELAINFCLMTGEDVFITEAERKLLEEAKRKVLHVDNILTPAP